MTMPNRIHNPNCDGDKCKSSRGQVRRLPISFGMGSAVIVCRACYEHEMTYRRERNTEPNRHKTEMFPLPAWNKLKVYAP